MLQAALLRLTWIFFLIAASINVISANTILEEPAKLIEQKTLGLKTKVIAVLPFSADKEDIKVASKLSEDLISVLSKSNKIIVVEKLLVERVYKEMALQQTGVFNEKSVAKIGNRLGAEAIIVGQVSSPSGSVYPVNIRMLQAKDKKNLWSGSISYNSTQEVTHEKMKENILKSGFWSVYGGLPLYQRYSAEKDYQTQITNMDGQLTNPTLEARAGSAIGDSGTLAFAYGLYFISFSNKASADGLKKTTTQFNQPSVTETRALSEGDVSAFGFGFSFSLFYRIPLWRYAVVEGGSHLYLGLSIGIGPGNVKMLDATKSVGISLPVKFVAGYSHSYSVSNSFFFELQYGPSSGYLTSSLSGQSFWAGIGISHYTGNSN